MFQVLTRE